MNQFTVLVLLLVVFCYCGGKYCPAVLKQNKQILLGVVGGLVLASFFGLRLEAMGHTGPRLSPEERRENRRLAQLCANCTSEDENSEVYPVPSGNDCPCECTKAECN